MKALVIKPERAKQIANGEASVLPWGWPTTVRGDVLILAGTTANTHGARATSVCIANLVDCRQVEIEDGIKGHAGVVFVFQNVRQCESRSVEIQSGIYDIDDRGNFVRSDGTPAVQPAVFSHEVSSAPESAPTHAVIAPPPREIPKPADEFQGGLFG